MTVTPILLPPGIPSLYSATTQAGARSAIGIGIADSAVPAPGGYPILTKVGTDICPKPDHPDFVSASINAANGPFFFSVFDLNTAKKQDGSAAIASPTARFVAIFSSDHTSGDGGLWVAWSDSPEGPFALASDDPAVDASGVTGPAEQLEAVRKILWNQSEEKFVVFPHAPNGAGRQVTYRLTTTDFVTFTTDSGYNGAVAIDGNDAQHYGYGALDMVGGNLYMTTLLNGFPERMYQRWVAVDAAWIYWQRVYGATYLSVPTPFMTLPATSIFMGLEATFFARDQWWGLFVVRTETDASASTTRDDEIYVAPLEADKFTFAGEPIRVIAQEATASLYGSATVHAASSLVADGKTYVYCSAIRTSDYNQAINVYEVS